MADTQEPFPSSRPRSRLRWTRQLHERFVEAVAALGGAQKATPKSVQKAMGVPDLTLYHLKSHLQKYRLALVKRINPAVSSNHGKGADCSAQESRGGAHDGIAAGDSPSQIDGNTSQRKPEGRIRLDEQIEVQRHLQVRVEAEARYLQAALMRAREMLAVRGPDSAAAAEVSELVPPAADVGFLSSSRSGGSRYHQGADCSGDSCLTTWESPEVRPEKPCGLDSTGLLHQTSGEDADDISSGAGKPVGSPVAYDSETGNRGGGSFHCRGERDDGDEALPGSSSGGQSRRRKACYRAAGEIDLNREPASPRCFVLAGAPVLELAHAAL